MDFAQHSNDLLKNFWGRKWSPCPIPSCIFVHLAIFCFRILPPSPQKSVKFIIQIHLNNKYSLIVLHSLIVFFKPQILLHSVSYNNKLVLKSTYLIANMKKLLNNTKFVSLESQSVTIIQYVT